MFQVEAMFDKYGIWDYVIYANDLYGNLGYYRFRCYHDGGWLEGYDMEPVIYWGA